MAREESERGEAGKEYAAAIVRGIGAVESSRYAFTSHAVGPSGKYAVVVGRMMRMCCDCER